MRDGIYRVEFRSGQTIGKGIAVADNDTIRGFDETYFYFVGHLAKYGRPKRRVLAKRYAPQAQGFPTQASQRQSIAKRVKKGFYSKERRMETQALRSPSTARGLPSCRGLLPPTPARSEARPSGPSEHTVRTSTSLRACEMCFGYRIWPARSKLTALNRPASTSFPVSSREVTRSDQPLRLCART